MTPSSDADDARLTAWLRACSPAVPDAGFTARVLHALPPRNAPRPRALPGRLGVALTGALAGLAVAGWAALRPSRATTPSAMTWPDWAALSPAVETWFASPINQVTLLTLAGTTVLTVLLVKPRPRAVPRRGC